MSVKILHAIWRSLLTSLAIAGSLWGATEAYTYFGGDALKNQIGEYWWIVYIVAPALGGVAVGIYQVFCRQSTDNLLKKLESALRELLREIRKFTDHAGRTDDASTQRMSFLDDQDEYELRIRTNPPELPSGIHRSELLEKLTPGHKITMIIAPSGYGKTFLACAFYQKNETKTLWYSVSEKDSEALNLFHALYGGLNRKFMGSQVASDPLFLEAIIESRDGTKLMAVYLYRYLEAHLSKEEDYHIILDDAYWIKENSSAAELIGEISLLLPRNIHLIVILRTGDANRFNARGRLRPSMITSDDLRFTKDEAISLLSEKSALSKPDIEFLYSRAEDWPLALNLTADIVKSGQFGSLQDLIGGRSGPGLVDYLIKISFDRLSPTTRDFLTLIAICPRFRSDIANYVLGSDDPDGEMYRIRQFYNAAIVLLGDGYIRLHDLLRKIVIERTEEQSEDALIALRIRAGNYFAEAEQYFAAFDLYSSARDQEKSARIFERLAERFRHRSWVLGKNEWVESLPDSVFDNSPWLCLCKGRQLEFRGKFTQAYEFALQALNEFKRRGGGDKHGLLTAYYQIGKLLQQHKKDSSALDYLKPAANLAVEMCEETMELVIKTKIAALGRLLGEKERHEAIQDLIKMKERLTESGSLIASAVHHVLGNCLRDIGQYSEAVQAYENSIRYKNVLDDRYGTAKSLRNQGIAYQLLGQLGKAESCLRKALSIQEDERINDQPGIPRTLDSLGYCCSRLGRLEEGIRCLKRALRIKYTLEKEQDIYGIAKTDAMLAEAYATSMDIPSAEAYLSRCQTLIEAEGYDWVREIAYRVNGYLRILSGQFDDAVTDFRKAIALGKRLGIKHRVIESSFKAASILAAQDKVKEARHIIDNCFEPDLGSEDIGGYQIVLRYLLRKLSIVRGSFGDGRELIGCDGICEDLQIAGMREELIGDIRRMEERETESAVEKYQKACEFYIQAHMPFREWCVMAKMHHIRSERKLKPPPNLPAGNFWMNPKMPENELFWIVF